MVGLVQTEENTTKEEANRLKNEPVREVEMVKSNGKTYTFSFEYGEKPLEEFLKKIIYK